jgi:hypothetical protein
MTEKTIASKKCLIYPAENASICLIQPVDGHGSELLYNEVELIKSLTAKPFILVACQVEAWNSELSPWEAPAVFGKDNFGSGANKTLSYITKSIIPFIKNEYSGIIDFYLGGYSLAGLFSLWSGYQTDSFKGVAGVSPSVWFPGWDSFIKSNEMKAARTFLSLGDREEKTRNKVMATVGDRIKMQYDNLYNDCVLEWNSGNHFADPDKRTAKGFAWLINGE